MKKAILLNACMVLVTMAVVALGTGPALADSFEKGPGGPGHGIQGKDGEERHQWLDKLNLSADQKKKIDQIRAEQREATKDSVEQLRAEHEKMHDMMQGDSTDAQLREQHGKVAALRSAVGEARFESFLKIRAVLSRGQRKRMANMHHDDMGSGGMRHGEPDMKDQEKK